MPLVLILLLVSDSPDVTLERDACGFHALYICARFVGAKADKLFSVLPITAGPFSYNELQEAAKALGCETRLIRWKDPSRASFPCPAILRVRRSNGSSQLDHFMVSFGEVGDDLVVADFPGKPAVISREHLAKFWDGEALYIDRVDLDRLNTLSPQTNRKTWLFGAGIATVISIYFWRWSNRRESKFRCLLRGLLL